MLRHLHWTQTRLTQPLMQSLHLQTIWFNPGHPQTPLLAPQSKGTRHYQRTSTGLREGLRPLPSLGLPG